MSLFKSVAQSASKNNSKIWLVRKVLSSVESSDKFQMVGCSSSNVYGSSLILNEI